MSEEQARKKARL